MSRPKFIAGAICPECGVMDRIVVEQHAVDGERRRCVACGFSDGSRPAEGHLPQTRFSGLPGRRRRDVAAVPVRLFPEDNAND